MFLAGASERIAARHRPRHVSCDGAAAWFDPRRAGEQATLRQLLRAFEGPLPARALTPDFTVRAPGDRAGARRRRLLVDVGHASVQDVLIHLHHTVCEAAIRGLVQPADVLELRAVEEIDARADASDCARVHADREDEGRLRMYTWLGSASPGLAFAGGASRHA